MADGPLRVEWEALMEGWSEREGVTGEQEVCGGVKWKCESRGRHLEGGLDMRGGGGSILCFMEGQMEKEMMLMMMGEEVDGNGIGWGLIVFSIPSE